MYNKVSIYVALQVKLATLKSLIILCVRALRGLLSQLNVHVDEESEVKLEILIRNLEIFQIVKSERFG